MYCFFNTCHLKKSCTDKDKADKCDIHKDFIRAIYKNRFLGIIPEDVRKEVDEFAEKNGFKQQ